MTTYEHAMLGITGTLAAGLQRRFGWTVAAVAGIAAVAPDWDGLAILFSQSAFAAGHRLWGHNILACLLAGIVIGVLDYRFDLVARCGRRFVRVLPPDVPASLSLRDEFSIRGFSIWILVAAAAALSHLPADLVFSGTASLPDWRLQPLWPFSNWSVIYPMVPWGDVGATLVFVAGMFAMLKWRQRLQSISVVTLAALVLYVIVRGLTR
jgi:membrane-bound metal-dependent hydrolase YbcI (DUF457 family)